MDIGTMDKQFGRYFCTVIAAAGLALSGCSNKMLDPAQIGRFRPAPAVNVILDSLGVAEEAPVVWANAEEPQLKDVVAVRGDYTLRSGDQVRISIFELFQEEMMVVSDYVVSETGKISIPSVGVIQAAGLTETQLEEEIKEILSPATLKDPSVTAVLINSQQRTFSILGDGVPQPNRYPIPRYDFRLADALATAGGPMQFNVSHIYVARAQDTAVPGLEPARVRPGADELELILPGSGLPTPTPSSVLPGPAESTIGQRRDIPEPSEPAEKFELEREMLELISPHAQEGPSRMKETLPVASVPAETADVSASVLPPGFRYVVAPKTLAANEAVISPTIVADGNPGIRPVSQASMEGRTEWVFRDGQWVEIPVQQAEAPSQRQSEPAVAEPTPLEPVTGPDEIEWVLRNNRWVPSRKGQVQPAQPPIATEPRIPSRAPEELSLPGETEWGQAMQTRLIKIPADKLMAGDPRYNIVIKPGDTIHVPVDIIGEFCITGNVNRGGFINITGRPMTLKMAIAAAGGLGPLAWPKYCEVVRRIGEKQEEIVMVDLDKIASGEQPDFFIKPNDLINVGTHPTSRWRAVLRNAFRAAYGFGFVYDRNFAYSEDRYGTSFF